MRQEDSPTEQLLAAVHQLAEETRQLRAQGALLVRGQAELRRLVKSTTGGGPAPPPDDTPSPERRPSVATSAARPRSGSPAQRSPGSPAQRSPGSPAAAQRSPVAAQSDQRQQRSPAARSSPRLADTPNTPNYEDDADEELDDAEEEEEIPGASMGPLTADAGESGPTITGQLLGSIRLGQGGMQASGLPHATPWHRGRTPSLFTPPG